MTNLIARLAQPPCSENVVWLIGNKPLYISAVQMQLLRNAAAHGAGVGSNFRPIQTVYKRSVRTNIQFTNLKVSVVAVLVLLKFEQISSPTY